MSGGIIILVLLIALFCLVLLILWLKARQLDQMYPEAPDQIVLPKNADFQTILEKFEVPKEHYPIVISQARTYQVINCPAVIWKTGETVKVLVLKAQPFVAEEELEDFLYITSSPFVNFRQFDGTEFPNWASQTKEIKELFLPYVEMTAAPGGIDRTRQQYWAGTICVYAPSLAQILRMMDRPLSDYEITVDSFQRMREDGSVPEDLLAQYDHEKQAAAKEAKELASSEETAALWEAIKRLEQENKELQKKLSNEEHS